MKLTVIIPTYNRARRLPVLLDALLVQTIDHGLSEVIVIDDGSSDETRAVLERYATGQGDGWIRALHQQNQGQAVARQYGVRVSRGEYLLFLDDDMEAASPEFLQSHLLFHQRSPVPTVALGSILPPKADPKRPSFERFYEKSIRSMYQSFEEGRVKPAGVHFFSANVSLPKQLFLAVGGFDSQYRHAEDRELGLRLQHKAQAAFAYVPAAAAYHNSPTGRFRSFMQRARLYGHYDLQIARLYPEHPELHPDQIFVSSSRLKRMIARLAFRWPFIVTPGSWILVPFARFLPGPAAIMICSVIYCLQYVGGYAASIEEAQNHV